MESAFKLKRVAATVILIVALVMTFVAAFVLPAILCIVFVIVSVSDVYESSRLLILPDPVSRVSMGKLQHFNGRHS